MTSNPLTCVQGLLGCRQQSYLWGSPLYPLAGSASVSFDLKCFWLTKTSSSGNTKDPSSLESLWKKSKPTPLDHHMLYPPFAGSKLKVGLLPFLGEEVKKGKGEYGKEE